ncbi:penicillin acylase family protein [Flavobacterium aquatile]|uniref:Penicillin amidase n=1 Tax=Flavobacterium aquatile LMG 4008 = ATCC 11947 TaxID=1453498 RepID=A0A095V3K1_9FLAO|nr:penicillin acylase family protein [Flavobacterium aquatile]KGD69440.1 penicillin amidase [Flavobacterium aquatile LMG 4008 = ATCC 11947]OXA66104.1 penicillin acylase family protein [Flavobacterium aquatile LMG 4008 = ATCC 11947]GEC77589.1 penicillin amidase [Flavobacterium aquatile]
MKRLKKILLLLLSLIILIAISVFGYTKYKKPVYDGEVALQNISKNTTVYFDDFGVPHIYADSQKDAMTVLGYVHAQDRLWQMELMRRIAPGRLSELFGSKALPNDIFFAGVGIDENSEKAIAQLDKNSEAYKLAIAYLDGVNQFIENGKTPLEFELVGVKKEKYTLKDVYNIFGFMSFSFAMAQKSDPLMTDIRDKFGAEYLKDFGLDGSLGTTQLKSYKGKSNDYAQISKSVASLLDNSPIPPFIGSNSWVIGAQKTKNGKVIFANDPHIGFSQPCTWYEAHIVTPDYEIYGYYLAGTPFPLLGHNRDYAYGLTMFENDDLDLFQEENNPNDENQYKTIDGFKNYTIRKKIIKIKDSTSVTLNIKESVHGPIMNDLLTTLKTKNPIAMSWIYTQEKNQILDAVYSLCHAKDVTDFYNKIELIHAPGLNVMYGDAKDNIAWITSGKLYKLDKSVNPNFILNGANGIDDKKEFLPYSKNPSAVNPSWNYVYSSNNQPEAVDGYLYPGYYLPKDRAKRIDGLLAPKNNWTATDVQKMIVDNTSSTSATVVASFLSQIDSNKATSNEKKGYEILGKWSGSTNEKDIAPTIYNKFIYHYLKNTFKDELGEDDFAALLSTHILKQIIEPQIANESSVWWDDFTTKNRKETRKEILNKSFKEAIASLEKQLGNDVNSWTWNKVHTLEHQHPLSKVAALRSYFNVGPMEIAGSNEVINNLAFTFSDNPAYEVKAGPSTRRIIDFSDVENSVSILPTGQSGVPSSKHYNDQAEMYAQGKFRKMKMNKMEIEATSTKLVFVPKK